MPRSQWSPSGAAKWPSHGLDIEELSWSWSFVPDQRDLEESQLMHQMLGDFAYNAGVMPDKWGWPALGLANSSASSISTMVFALQDVWPGNGVRAEVDWRKDRCDALLSVGIDEMYWWCD